MNYKIYDKVICIVDCESIAQRFNSKDQSRQIKKGEIFTIYGMSKNALLLSLSEGDSHDPRFLVRCENFHTIQELREIKLNKLGINE